MPLTRDSILEINGERLAARRSKRSLGGRPSIRFAAPWKRIAGRRKPPREVEPEKILATFERGAGFCP